ncbi:MAG: peptidoglycan-binding domain-containing protein [Patescibacteria group bacterium]
MNTNKLLAAFAFALAACGTFWYGVATQGIADQAFNETGLQVSFSNSEAQEPEESCMPMSVSITRTLKKGSQGDDVRQLQRFLTRDYALDPEEIMTGYFGDQTVRWVKEFQLDQRLPQTGILDAATNQAIQRELALECTY